MVRDPQYIDSSNIYRNKSKPLVSVIMNCYNCEKYLVESIDSVINQSYSNWELIFWDNVSVDGTANIVHCYDDARIRYFCGSKTVPLGVARNLALSQVRGEFIAFLDSDDKWMSNKLDLQVSWFNVNPNYGFVYSNYYKLINNIRQRSKVLKGSQPEGNVFSEFLIQYPVNLQTVMIRTSAMNSVDMLFDLKFELVEEYDLFMRLLYQISAGYIEAPLVEYRVHNEMSSNRKISLWPIEHKMALENLKRIVPNFDKRFEDELVYTKAKIGYYEARASISEGDMKSARESLYSYRNVGYRYRLLYLLTFFPIFVWKAIHKYFARFA